ncbi:MAG: alpha/beta hydrolase [Candidatus Dadabacteria bacterium]|nr:alpha/beta hydrolase [Candidatus Dadabacteria bacterium]
MSEISIQGNKLHYIEGDKFDKSRPTILLIHAAGQSVSTWRFQLDLFRNHPSFNLIALDLPGRGGSGGEGFHTVSEYKELVLEFTEHLNLKNIILVGHSMGGGVAMLIALEHPEIIKACVLAATGAKLSVAEQTLEVVKNNYEAFCEISPDRMFAEDSADELKQEFKKGLFDTGSHVCYRDLIACNEFNIMDAVENISVPTLIISADKDILTPTKYGEYLHQKIYGSQLYLVKDSGHFIMQEKAEEFNGILVEFLNDFIE